MSDPAASIETTGGTLLPEAGKRYHGREDPGRILLVREVQIGEPSGREVVGLVYAAPVQQGLVLSRGEGRPYATSLQVWAHVWAADA